MSTSATFNGGKGRAAKFHFAARPLEKAAFGAKTTPQISRRRARNRRFFRFLQTGGTAPTVSFTGQGYVIYSLLYFAILLWKKRFRAEDCAPDFARSARNLRFFQFLQTGGAASAISSANRICVSHRLIPLWQKRLANVSRLQGAFLNIDY
ncbi:MAG: hypothetical protein HFG26_04745 [Provencibacterium sp.]|nr:hypothetical protein [Provencibacterium sp.]